MSHSPSFSAASALQWCRTDSIFTALEPVSSSNDMHRIPLGQEVHGLTFAELCKMYLALGLEEDNGQVCFIGLVISTR